MKLKRYWVITFPENRYGPKNFGVTAYTAEQAKEMIKKEAEKNPYFKEISSGIDTAEIIEDIDIRNLDQNHVVPNMGTVAFMGVWYPNMNM